MRSRNEGLLIALFLSLVIFIFYHFNLHPWGFLRISSLRTNDFFSNLSRAKKTLPEGIKDIVVVEIDNDTLVEQGLQWPWKRSVFAELVNRISQGNPRAIFLDFTFLGKADDEAMDLSFSQALKKAGNVILAGYIDEYDEFVKPNEIFVSASSGVGLVNKKSDSRDLRVRSMQAVFLAGRKSPTYDYSVEIKLLALVKGIPLSRIEYIPESGRVILSPQISFLTDHEGNIPLNYSADNRDFSSVAAYQILREKPVAPFLFKDKIVLVGMTADITHDIHPTPLGKRPGIYINANSLLMLISGNFIKTLPFGYATLLFLFFCLGMGFLSYQLKAVYSTLILGITVVASSALYLFLQIRYNFQMDIFSLIFLTAVSYLAVEVYKYISLIIESEKLKMDAIIDPLTVIYTQRYFYLSVQHALGKLEKKPAHFFCLVYINEFEQLKKKYAHTLAHLIKMLSETIKVYIGKKSLIARYGEDALSLCVWNVKRRRRLEKSLSLLCSEIANREFILDKEVIKLSVQISAISFPRENVRSYEDLALTCELLLKGIGQETMIPLAIFDPKTDKLVRSSVGSEETKAMPESELGYVRMDWAARNKELETVIEELRQQKKKIEQYYFFTMHSLVRALEEKDPYTAGHSERVGFYATELAREMNLPRDEVDAVNRAAYLHDIGKISLPDKILHKKERLTDDEFEFVKRHQAAGAKILQGIPFYEQVVPYILYHHERYDGKGYPHGLAGEMIPLGAQLIAIADAFDAMTTGRDYNKPLGAVMDEAIAELRKCSGTQFNSVYVSKFIELLEQKKIHTLLKTSELERT